MGMARRPVAGMHVPSKPPKKCVRGPPPCFWDTASSAWMSASDDHGGPRDANQTEDQVGPLIGEADRSKATLSHPKHSRMIRANAQSLARWLVPHTRQ